MSESLVNSVLFKLSQFLREEQKLLTVVRREAEFIKHELELMNDFLRAADLMNDNDQEPSLKLLLKEIRDVAFYIEDALDGFELHLKYDVGSRGFNLLLRCFLRWIARNDVVWKVHKIKFRVKNISSKQHQYLIKNDIVDQASCSDNGLKLIIEKAAFLVDEDELVGIEKPKKELIDWLLKDDSQRQVVAIAGMGGSGKSTLAKKVYSDLEIRIQYMFCAWVHVSLCSSTENVLRDMIKQLFVVSGDDPQDIESMKYDELRGMIKEYLKPKKYLVVLDDVWDENLWNVFDFILPENDCGSRVMITTRNSGTAFLCCAKSPDKVYIMDPLTPEESWTLFCNKVFQRKPCPQHLWNVSQEILARCEGLPLAIVAVSGVLGAKNENRIDDWEMVRSSLDNNLGDNSKLSSLRKLLLLSYNDLPSHLKPCLLYFSIFPKGELIDSRILYRLWIAEGFVKRNEGTTLEEVAEEYLNELVKRILVQVVETTIDGRVKLCRIHDLVHDCIIWKSTEQDFAAIVVRDQEKEIMQYARRLSIQNRMTRLHKGSFSPGLRSLFIFLGRHSFAESAVSNLFLDCIKLLNVLDLGGMPLMEFPKEVEKFHLLKYLSLRNTNIKSIPSTIEKLQNLETLDVKHARVTELPVEILTLKKLQHLLVYRYVPASAIRVNDKYGCKAPSQIGGLQSVQKLCFVESNRTLIIDLARLKHLRRLGIIKFRKEDGETLCSSIEKLGNLHSLSITAIKESEVIDLDYISSPPKSLQRIYLTGRLEKLPNWIGLLKSLVKLVLRWTKLSNNPLQSLQHLPNLAHLEFIQAYDGEALHFQANGFQNLKLLELKKLASLKQINMEQGALPGLEKLVLQGLKSLQRIPSGIEHLKELKTLELFDMPEEAIADLKPKNGNENHSTLEHIPQVYSTFMNNDTWNVLSRRIDIVKA